MIKTNLPYQMSVDEAARLMHDNLSKKPAEERDYIVKHFLGRLRATGIQPSETFIQAFEMAIAPFKES